MRRESSAVTLRQPWVSRPLPPLLREGPMPSALRLLRIEGLAALAAALVAYSALGGSWLLFVLLLLAPDVFMVGYLLDLRKGAAIYNLGHTYAVPLILLGIGWTQEHALTLSIALIWVAHIGMDRALGYGLKLPSGFGDTHLGTVGERKAAGAG